MLIVDGSNVPSPRRPWHPVMCSGARRLVLDVARLTRDWEACADVVFDGHPRGGLRQRGLIAAVRVVFSERFRADDVIVRLVQTGGPDESFVVTSDIELARRVGFFGARVVSSEALRRALDLTSGAAHTGSTPGRSIPSCPLALCSF